MNQAPAVIAKVVPFHYIEGQLLVALISRPHDTSPTWRLPESAVYNTHTSLQSLEQMLRSRCGLTPRNVRYREQLYMFEESVLSGIFSRTVLYPAYLYLCNELLWHKGSEHIGLFPIENLPPISPLDERMIRYAIERMQAKALYTTLPALLLPSEFTLAAYQQSFETLTGRAVDKRNFRKKLLALNALIPIKTKSEPKRSDAQLYQLRLKDLTVLAKSF